MGNCIRTGIVIIDKTYNVLRRKYLGTIQSVRHCNYRLSATAAVYAETYCTFFFFFPFFYLYSPNEHSKRVLYVIHMRGRTDFFERRCIPRKRARTVLITRDQLLNHQNDFAKQFRSSVLLILWFSVKSLSRLDSAILFCC